MEKRKPEIIRDNKKRGEWAESVFVARAVEHGLEISKPFGESGRFDCVVGGPGKFVAVQVKCTIAKQPNAKGYICNLKSNNKKYRPGSFDFVAAYATLKTRGTSSRRRRFAGCMQFACAAPCRSMNGIGRRGSR